MMTTPITNIYTPTSSSGQTSGTAGKASSLLGTPQPSGDFLGMLMGVFGQMTPTSDPKMGDSPITQTPLTLGSGAPVQGSDLPDLSIDVEANSILNGLNSGGENLGSEQDSFELFMKPVLSLNKNDVPLKDFSITEPITPALSSKIDAQPVGLGMIVGGQNNLNDLDVLGNDLEGIQNISLESIPTPSVHEGQSDVLPGMPDALTTTMIDAGSVAGINMTRSRGALSQGVPIKATNQFFFESNNNGYSANFLAANDTYKPVLSVDEAMQGDLKSSMVPMSDQLNDVMSGLDSGLELDLQNNSLDPRGNDISRGAMSSSQASGNRDVGVFATAHNVTQAVILHLQSIAQNRDTRSFTLHLDPPELGKMQVKMSYGRDKSVRADIMLEKSDTLRLMEQDSNSLKSALENTGLQIDPGSLNFSLADQGAFDRSDSDVFMGRTDHQNEIGIESGDDIAGFEFKSSEEWSVDPSTGITRYNIVV